MDSKRSKIGLVTVTYNSSQYIDAFVRSVLSQDFEDFRLYIIDNASSDATRERLDLYQDPRFVRVDNGDNKGVAEGNNQGIVLAQADGCSHVLLINNDTEFDSTLLSAMLRSLDEHGADMLVPKMMFFEPKDIIWCAGGTFLPWRGYAVTHYGEKEKDTGQYGYARQIQYAPTCCMLIKASVFDRIGLMDPLYFVYYDDVDFCWRALKSNLQLWYSPSATLYHKVGGLTGGKASTFTLRFSTRNKVYFILKNLRRGSHLFWLGLYQLLFVGRFLSRRDSLEVYNLKRKAFAEGRALYHSHYNRGLQAATGG